MNDPRVMTFQEWFAANLDLAEQLRSERGLDGLDGLGRSGAVTIIHAPDGDYIWPTEVVSEMRNRYQARKQADQEALKRYMESLLS